MNWPIFIEFCVIMMAIYTGLKIAGYLRFFTARLQYWEALLFAASVAWLVMT